MTVIAPVTSDAVSKSTLRQRRHRQRLALDGLVEITIKVPASEASEFKILAARMVANRDMVIGNPKSRTTGRMFKA